MNTETTETQEMETQMEEATIGQTSAPEGAAQSQTAQGADLTVQDLQALKVIIDVASQRGSFKPNEMMTVGAVYTKLETFLQAIAASQQAQQTAEGSSSKE